MTDEQRIKCDEIVTFCGLGQTIIAIEEMAELQQALSKWFRMNERRRQSGIQPPKQTAEDIMANVVEELADVSIMLEQMKYMMQIDEAEIEAVIDKKLNRTENAIENAIIEANF